MMKTFSIVKTPLFTLILAFMLVGTIGISAAVKKEQPKVVKTALVNKSWHFTGGLGSSPTNAALYVESSSPTCSPGTATICAIQAPDDGTGKPDMTAPVEVDNPDPNDPAPTVAQQINDAITSSAPNETVSSLRSF